MFKRKQKIPIEQLQRFEELRRLKLVLKSDTPLMPKLNPSGFFRTMKLMPKIKMLPAGTEIELDEIGMSAGVRVWYRVHVAGSLVSGWLNSLHFDHILFDGA